jgi:hypothetical protein
MSAWECRSGATLTFDSGPRVSSSYSVWSPEEEDLPRRTRRVTPAFSNEHAPSSATLVVLAEPEISIDSVLPVIRPKRPTKWFEHAIPRLPKRKPHISPLLLGLETEDEPEDE